MLRKNISIDEKEYNIILNYIRSNNISFSEFLRETALTFIKKQEELDLLQFLNDNCEYMSKEENEEIRKMNIDFSEIEGRAIKLEEIL